MKNNTRINILYEGYEKKFNNARRPVIVRLVSSSKDNLGVFGTTNLFIDGKIIEQHFREEKYIDLPQTGVYILEPNQKFSEPNHKGEKKLISNLTARAFNGENSEDWFILFWEYKEMIRLEYPMPCALIAFALNSCFLQLESITDAINRPHFTKIDKENILECICSVAWSLSKTQISYISKLLCSFGRQSTISFPEEIYDAAKCLNLKSLENSSVNKLVNEIVTRCESTDGIPVNNNPFIYFIRRLLDGGEIPFDYYKIFFPYLNEDYRAKAIRRYFFEIKKGNAKYSDSTLEIFLSRNYYYYSEYRYIFEKWPSERNFATEFLFDCLNTYRKTEQQNFQNYNGILDWAISQSITRRSLIELNFKDWLLSCNGGVLLNPDFRGFAEFNIKYEFDDLNFEDEPLKQSIQTLIQYSADRRHHYIEVNCVDLDTGEPKINPKTKEIIKEKKIIYEDIWDVKKDRKPVADIFVNWEINDDFEPKENTVSFSKKMIDYSIVKSKVLEYSYAKFNTDKPTLSYRDNNLIVQCFGSRVTMTAVISNDTTLGAYSDEMDVTVVRDYVKLKLQEIFGENLTCDYDQARLFEAFKISLFNNAGTTTYDCFKYEKLKIHPYKYERYCSPKLSDTEMYLTGKKFCNCEHDMCFKTSINHEPSWQDYKLVHLLEIIGYPVLEESDAGYIPIDTYKLFVGQINKAIRFYKRLKCRECGHLLFPVDRNENRQNLYTKFKCVNPLCSDYSKEIYMNYCFECKSGIIDSRDTRQCPNGSYICPTCKSCCSDARTDKIIQRYILNNWKIPARISNMQGNGHKERNMFFCHKCGRQMLHIGGDECDGRNYFCTNCDNNNELDSNPSNEIVTE